MAKKFHLLTAFVFLLLCVAGYFIAEKNFLHAAVLSVIAYLIAGKELQSITGVHEVIAFLLSALLLGIALTAPLSQIPFIAIACVLTNIPFASRILFYQKFTMTRFTWVEALGVGIAIVFYLTGNIIQERTGFYSDWQRWILPLAPIGFSAGIAFGILHDTPGLLVAAKKGYKVQPGKAAPEFSLPDQNDILVNLSSFKGKRNLLLLFVRGDWCPWCHMMLRTYQKESSRFSEKNILLLAIGPDPVGTNKQMAEKLGIEFLILSDVHQQTAMLYGCQLSPEEDKNLMSTNPAFQRYAPGIPLPASFLIDKNGIVRYVSRPDRIGEFLDPSTIFPALEQL